MSSLAPAPAVLYDSQLAAQCRAVIDGQYEATPAQVAQARTLLSAMMAGRRSFGAGVVDPEPEPAPVPLMEPETGIAGISFDFVRAGRAIFTVEIPPVHAAKKGLRNRYTFRMNRVESTTHTTDRGETSKSNQWVYFLGVLTGPNNDRDYTYVGLFDPMMAELGKAIKTTRKSAYKEDSALVKLANYVLCQLAKGKDLAAGYVVHHEGKCGRCGATLSTPDSIRLGIGPECLKKLGD